MKTIKPPKFRGFLLFLTFLEIPGFHHIEGFSANNWLCKKN